MCTPLVVIYLCEFWVVVGARFGGTLVGRACCVAVGVGCDEGDGRWVEARDAGVVGWACGFGWDGTPGHGRVTAHSGDGAPDEAAAFAREKTPSLSAVEGPPAPGRRATSPVVRASS
jgi:hypothetical protein